MQNVSGQLVVARRALAACRAVARAIDDEQLIGVSDEFWLAAVNQWFEASEVLMLLSGLPVPEDVAT